MYGAILIMYNAIISMGFERQDINVYITVDTTLMMILIMQFRQLAAECLPSLCQISTMKH